MNFFANNLKFLRKQKKLTQADFAKKIGINRPKVGSYEEGRAEPNMETLQNISHFFKVKMDDLVEVNLIENDNQSKKDISGKGLRILPIVVDENDKEKVSLVSTKAAAGYLNGYADPEFIEQLPAFNLPLQETQNGTYRLFQIKGDSMLPIPSSSYIIGQYVDNWERVKDNSCYVFVTQSEGIVYKRAINKVEESQSFELHSDNKNYEPYSVKAEEVMEVWEAKGYLTFDLPTIDHSALSVDQLSEVVMQLKGEVERLKDK
ncbi:MAG: transcriptional regulator [Flavobacteriales bacterium]|nr:transcriptional regulator [Flavobacteriales bacterium]|tara:strand:+ start:1041 stop:1823 length:783 start_codon:yes stop_codon:yes gene_type:complete